MVPPVLVPQRTEGGLTLVIDGCWNVHRTAPDVSEAQAALRDESQTVMLRAGESLEWDSLAVATLWQLTGVAQARGVAVDASGLPQALRAVLSMAAEPPEPAPPSQPPHPITRLGYAALLRLERAKTTLRFVGDVVHATLRLLRGRTRMRRADLLWQIEQAGPRSLPIVALIAFLVGLILAYMGAAQLKMFGAQVFIADLVTIGVVREIAALMTGIILAGRIGAAYAAELGTMQVNEETDAVRAMGLDPIDALVLPRLLAITLMAPLLTICAGASGMLAGMLTAVVTFDIGPVEYMNQSRNALSFSHVSVGLIKGTSYAALVGLAGCRQGIEAGRSAQAVGEATTRAVVQSIVWIVVAASGLTIIFQRLDV